MAENQESSNNHDENSELAKFREELHAHIKKIESLVSVNNKLFDNLNQVIEKSNQIIVAADEYKNALTKVGEEKKELEENFKDQPGIKEFVQQTLFDIMQGVDNAATKATCQAAKSGLQAEGFLSSVSMIGAPSSAEPQVASVEFDLMVTAAKGAEGSETERSGFGLLLNVVPMILNFGGVKDKQSTTGESTSTSLANRIRFSVPITYASQSDPLDEE